MAPSPQKASWRRVDANLSPSDVGGVSSVSGQQSSPLAGQGVSSSLDDFPLPSTTFQAISSPSIAISPSSSVTATTSPAAISTPPLSHADIEMSSQPLSDALSPTNTQSIFSSFRISTFTVPTSGPSFVVSSPLTSSGSPYISAFSEPTFTLDPSLFITSGSRSLPAATTEFFAATGALDVIAPLPLDVQSKPQTPAPTDNIPSSSLFGASVVADTTSPLQLTNVLADEPLEPALTSLSSNSVPSSSSRPSVSLGGDVPVTTRAEFTDVPSPAISTPTERQPQTITAASIGGPVDTSIPNGENPAVASPFIAGTKIPSSAVGTALTVPATDAPLGYGGVPTVSAPLTSALPSLGETGTTTITGPTTTIIATTGITSVPSSVISGVSQVDLFEPHHPFFHDKDNDDKFQTSSFTTSTEVVFLSRTVISGTPTSIPITETIQTAVPTVVPARVFHSPNTVPVAVIVVPILSVAAVIALILCFLRRRWRVQEQRIQRRIHWPTFVGFSQVRETHRVSVLRSEEQGAPYLPPLQSTVGWNDLPPGAFTFGEPAQDPFAPTPPMLVRSLPDVSGLSTRPLSTRTIRRIPVPDPFMDSPGRVSTLMGSPEEPNRLSQSQASSHDEQGSRAPTSLNSVGWAV